MPCDEAGCSLGHGQWWVANLPLKGSLVLQQPDDHLSLLEEGDAIR